MRLAICFALFLAACGQRDPTPVVFAPAAHQTRAGVLAEQRDSVRTEERASRSRSSVTTTTVKPYQALPRLTVRPRAAPALSALGGCGPGTCTGWTTAQASWYGPGFYGHHTACGQTYTASIIGVAHRTLPCGTLITFEHNGVAITAPVIDRGPYVAGRTWDLSQALCQRLAHCFTGTIHYRN